MRYIVDDKRLSKQAKDYLSQIHKTDALINRLVNTVATLRSSLTSIGCELKPDKVRTSGSKRSLEETFCKIDELESAINTRIDELLTLKQTTFNMLKRIPDLDQQNILIARYIQNLKWDAIADEMGHEIRWVYKTHNKALAAFADSNGQLLAIYRQAEKGI